MEQKKRCAACGQFLDASDSFCRKCGARVAVVATPPRPQPAPQVKPKSKKKKPNWFLRILLILFVLGLVNSYLEEHGVDQFFPSGTTSNQQQVGSQPNVPPVLATKPTAKPEQPGATQPGATQPAIKPTVKPTDPYNPVPSELRNNVYLDARGDGDCESFTGDVMITIIFVSDPNHKWTNSAMNEAKESFNADVNTLEKDAKKYGAELDVQITYLKATISVTHDRDSRDWEKAALKALNMEDIFSDQEKLEKRYGVDEAPVVFVLNQKGRSYASVARSDRAFERAVIYSDGYHALRHELYHNFGARDFYFPAEVEELANQYLSNSIMVDSGDGITDDLTAFLIGWTDELSSEAQNFLRKTNWITNDYLETEKEKETLTGYGTKEASNGTYTGYMVEGVYHGQGTFTWDSGAVYTGNWEHGVFSGQGTMKYDNGNVYSGAWKDGVKHGYGTYTWESGAVYEGNWNNGDRHGKGTMVFDGGSKYEGDWVNDKRTGDGTYTWPSGAYYTGKWVDNDRNGYGEMRFDDGSVYKGNWSNDVRSGQGTMKYANGNVYTGAWKDGKRNGQGKFTWKSGAVYEGNWKDDYRHGKGTMVYDDGSKYVGDWKDSKRNGQGTFTWTSGDKYVGDWVDDKRTGYGIYYWPEGSRHEGYWKENKRHGEGTHYYADGSSKTGTWKDDKYVG